MLLNNEEVPEHRRCKDTIEWPLYLQAAAIFSLDGAVCCHDVGQGYWYKISCRYKHGNGIIRLTRRDPEPFLGLIFNADDPHDEEENREAGYYFSSVSAFIKQNHEEGGYECAGLFEAEYLNDVDEKLLEALLPTYALPLVDGVVYREDHIVQLLNHVMSNPLYSPLFTDAKNRR